MSFRDLAFLVEVLVRCRQTVLAGGDRARGHRALRAQHIGLRWPINLRVTTLLARSNLGHVKPLKQRAFFSLYQLLCIYHRFIINHSRTIRTYVARVICIKGVEQCHRDTTYCKQRNRLCQCVILSRIFLQEIRLYKIIYLHRRN